MSEKTRPNVIFVFADQLRGCSVGYADQEPVKTPHIDRFASKGAIFKNAVSMIPVCGPYRACLMTGRTPLTTGVVLNDIALKTTEVSMAHAFKEADYDTAYIGKWHLDGPDRSAPVPPGPRRLGFDFWMGANFEHNYHRSRYTDNDGAVKVWKGWDAEAQTTETIRYFDSRNGRDKPFFLVLSWGPPHHPYRLAPQKYLDLYDPEVITVRPNCRDMPREDLWGYYAQTTFLDDQFQRIVEALDARGMSENTILVFTSDHGDMHGSHGVYKKQWPWNESILVPFVLRYPGVVEAGMIFDFPISVIDIMPTLLSLAGVSVPDTVEGVDLSPFIRGDRDDPPESVLIMNPCPFSVGDPRGPDQYPHYNGMRLEYRGVITDRYTYVRTIDQPWLLYDNPKDLFQLTNLIDSPEHEETRRYLDALMRAHMDKIGDEFLAREAYYERFQIKLDHRGKVAALIENKYDRAG